MTDAYFSAVQYKEGIIEEDIQASVDYNNHILPTLIEICEPLFSETSFTVFEYSKFYRDGRFLHLCTHAEWHKIYMDSFSKSTLILEHMKTVFDEKRKFHTWDTTHTECIHNREYLEFINTRRNLDMFGDYAIYQHDDNSVECWRFTLRNRDTFNINSYINKKNDLECFIVYFKGQAADIINQAKKIKIVGKEFFVTENLNPSLNHKEKSERFLERIRLKKYKLETPKGVIELSVRELQCLGYRSRGLSDKEIAKKIINRETKKHITVGTVRVHFEKIKQKSYGQPMSQLRDIFLDNTLAYLPLGDL